MHCNDNKRHIRQTFLWILDSPTPGLTEQTVVNRRDSIKFISIPLGRIFWPSTHKHRGTRVFIHFSHIFSKKKKNPLRHSGKPVQSQFSVHSIPTFREVSSTLRFQSLTFDTQKTLVQIARVRRGGRPRVLYRSHFYLIFFNIFILHILLS